MAIPQRDQKPSESALKGNHRPTGITVAQSRLSVAIAHRRSLDGFQRLREPVASSTAFHGFDRALDGAEARWEVVQRHSFQRPRTDLQTPGELAALARVDRPRLGDGFIHAR